MADYTEFLKLLIFPDITGVYQRELRQAYDSNAQLIDEALKDLSDALNNLKKSFNDLDIPGKVPIATKDEAGKVRPDGDTILIDADGIIRAAVKVALASMESAGIVKPDGTSITIEADGTIHANITDAYSKEEVDQMLMDMSEMLISETDLTELYTATNTLMGETVQFSGLGDSIIAIDALAGKLLE